MKEENQLKNATEVATKEDVLKKTLYSLTFEEINTNFNKVECQLVRRKFGTGQNVTYRYTANLLFKKGIFEKQINLTQLEYNMVIYKRTGSKAIPDSYKTNVFYLAVKSERANPNNPEEKITSYQLKIVLSDNIRKKEWLTTTEVQGAEMFDALKFIDRPDLVEADDEEIRTEAGF